MPKFGFNFPLRIFRAVDLPIPFVPTLQIELVVLLGKLPYAGRKMLRWLTSQELDQVGAWGDGEA